MNLMGRGLSKNRFIGLVFEPGPEFAAAMTGARMFFSTVALNPDTRRREALACFQMLKIDTLLVQRELENLELVATAKECDIDILFADFRLTGPAGTFDLENAGFCSDWEPRPTSENDVAYVSYTSGTTDVPKLIEHTHASAILTLRRICSALNLSTNDVFLNVMPLYHSTGSGLTEATLISGGTIYCAPGFEPSLFFDWVEESRATWFSATPAMYRALIDQSVRRKPQLDKTTLRFIRSANAPLKRNLAAEIENLFGVSVIEAYGLTETGLIACGRPPPLSSKPGSVGLSVGWEIGIFDDRRQKLLEPGQKGEISVKKPVTKSGKRVIPAESARTNWFFTGDLGFMDQDGYLYVTGRRKELINSGGQKVAPLEVEQVLEEHPAVKESAVFPLSHELMGEAVGAAVVLKTGESVNMGALQTYVARHLMHYKVPHQIHVVKELPRNEFGKVRRDVLSRKFDKANERLITDAVSTQAITPVEKALSLIWAETFDIPAVRLEDDFLYLGGDSIKATLIAGRVYALFGVKIPLSLFFEAHTLREHTQFIQQRLNNV